MDDPDATVAPRSPDRREILRAAFACGALLVPGGSSELDLDAFLDERVDERARRVGERCRAAGVPADEAALLHGYSGTGTSELALFLAGRVRADFAEDRLVEVGAWLLSETECRVLALL